MALSILNESESLSWINFVHIHEDLMRKFPFSLSFSLSILPIRSLSSRKFPVFPHQFAHFTLCWFFFNKSFTHMGNGEEMKWTMSTTHAEFFVNVLKKNALIISREFQKICFPFFKFNFHYEGKQHRHSYLFN